MRSPIQAILLCGFASGLAGGAEKIDFNRDIRPILSDRCFKCHGPDARNQKSDFRLDSFENATADLGGYAGVVPGDLEASELHFVIHAEDPDERMPPPQSKMSLSAGEKDLLDRWIREGAPYDTLWSLKPLPPTVPVPEATAWARTPVDAFIERGARKAGLTPNEDGASESWLRRVTFDLTGLPPTLKELDSFHVALRGPEGGERAYAAVVARLLATDAYAERMTSEWLDVARYSDSYGYQRDNERFVWPWRDWVIRAFRENLPYDDFITWQLAGDLLPNPTRDQVLATTFNRLHPQKVEGGSVPEEFRVEYVSDRLHTFGTAFLGLTLECCRCHDHKYDPVTMKEYYALSSFFANIDEAGLYSYFTRSIPSPTLLLTTAAQDKQLADADTAIAAAEQAVQAAADTAGGAFDQWLMNRARGHEWHGLLAHVTFDDRSGNGFPDRVRGEKPATSNANNKSVPGKRGEAVQLTGDDPVKLPGVGNFARWEPFTVGLWLNTPKAFERTVVARRSKAWTDAASRGYELLLEDGKPSVALVHFYPGNAIRVRATDPLPVDTWQHVAFTYDGSSTAAGLRLYVNGRPAATEVVRDHLTKTIRGGGENDLALGERFRDVGFKGGMVDDLLVFDRELTPLEVAELHDGRSLQAALEAPADRLTPELRAQLRAWFLAGHPPHAAALAKLEETRAAKAKLVDGIKEIMVMREMDEPRPSYVLERGLYSERGEPVTAGTPAALPPFPGDAPRNRLGLARWVTSGDHPLTARVTVNCYWQMFFGHGLVRTPEDFGSQG
ncbi:MAG: DUF1549 domain-containing protein, partial [Akkermansiaceae bacterium]|nr:DUF1549 domain-containing protein [Akkermansiaceae bacterium]